MPKNEAQKPHAPRPTTPTTEARKVARKKVRRAARAEMGRCPYCGKFPVPGKTRCARCIALQATRDRARAERLRAEREQAAREAAPRRCPQCGSGDHLRSAGTRKSRPYYKCRACRRYSFGDGPAAPSPNSPCPYCRGRCVKSGLSKGKPRLPVYLCTACHRRNTNLYPADAPSPGGPFRQRLKICLNYAAKINLMEYIQAKKMSQAQAVRDIFIRAGQAPLAHITHIPRPLGGWTDDDDDDLWSDNRRPRTVAIPAPPQPTIPPGGVRFPDLRPEAAHKLATQSGAARYCPTVLVVWEITACLNDAALAGLIATMQRRKLNHQEAARALCAEAKP